MGPASPARSGGAADRAGSGGGAPPDRAVPAGPAGWYLFECFVYLVYVFCIYLYTGRPPSGTRNQCFTDQLVNGSIVGHWLQVTRDPVTSDPGHWLQVTSDLVVHPEGETQVNGRARPK